MFTGIVQSVGIVRHIERVGEDLTLEIAAHGLAQDSVHTGDSVAVNGVCLTAAEVAGAELRFDVSAETISRTLLGQMEPGQRVNLELALLPTTRLGGHFVSGHVDGVGRLLSTEPVGRSVKMCFELPAQLSRFVAEKGSVCIDGVSLTVNWTDANQFEVNIVPHTLGATALGDYQPGHEVHIEVDLIARYLERLLRGDDATNEQGAITRQFLSDHGFLPPSD